MKADTNFQNTIPANAKPIITAAVNARSFIFATFIRFSLLLICLLFFLWERKTVVYLRLMICGSLANSPTAFLMPVCYSLAKIIVLPCKFKIIPCNLSVFNNISYGR